MKLSSFVATADLTLDLSEYVEEGEDGTLHVTVDKNAITPAMTRRAAAASEADEGDVIVETILVVVKKWDLMETARKPVPLTDEAVSQIGSYFLFSVFSKIIEELEAETEAEGKASAAVS